MQKRAQLSVFIIAGILILSIVGFLVYLKSVPDKEPVPASMAHVKIFVEQCVKQTAEDALLVAGAQGGYVYLDNIASFENFYSDVAYWYDEGVEKTPTKETVEADIARYIAEEINVRCLHNFEVFPGEDITIGQANVDVILGKDSMTVDMKLPIEVKQENIVTEISEFSAEVPTSMSRALDAGKKIVEMEAKDPDWIDMDYLATLEFDVAHFNYGDVTVYSVIDEENPVAGMPFRMIFANRFPGEAV